MGVMFGGIIISITLLVTDGFFGIISDEATLNVITEIRFSDLLIASPFADRAEGSGALLGLLLFATALRIEPTIFTRFRIGSVIWLASGGVIITALGTAVLLMLVIWAFTGTMPDFRYMLLFGAILAPTDPVAVIDILSKANVNTRVRDLIGGEALINDASSIILFLLVIAFLPGSSSDLTTAGWVLELTRVVLGGLITGAILGLITSFLIRSSRGGVVVVLLSLSASLGVCVITPLFDGSVPLAAVTCGLIVGRAALVRLGSKSEDASGFWWVVEQIITTIIFLLVGLELLIVDLDLLDRALWGLAAVPLLLLVRAIAVLVPWLWSRRLKNSHMTTGEALLITWCGLRGTVSLAMALAIPATLVGAHNGQNVRDIAIICTFVVVLTTLSLQGLTIPVLVRYLRENPL